jgi:hypothetical protein
MLKKPSDETISPIEDLDFSLKVFYFIFRCYLRIVMLKLSGFWNSLAFYGIC